MRSSESRSRRRPLNLGEISRGLSEAWSHATGWAKAKSEPPHKLQVVHVEPKDGGGASSSAAGGGAATSEPWVDACDSFGRASRGV